MIRLLYIDLFCGAGGTTTGVEAARIGGEKCAKVIACVNHVRYVHELQHILRLQGLTDFADQFKVKGDSK